MPRYLCPVSTCNVSFEGSVADIIPPASGHMGGSHGQDYSDADIITIIQRQADPNYQNTVGFTSTTGPSHSTPMPKKHRKPFDKAQGKLRKVRSNLKATSEEKKKWWEKMGGK